MHNTPGAGNRELIKADCWFRFLVSLSLLASVLAKLSVLFSYRFGCGVNFPTCDHCRRDLRKFALDRFVSHARDAVVSDRQTHADARCDPRLGDEFGKLPVDLVRR